MSKKSCVYYVRVYDMQLFNVIESLAQELKKKDISKNDIIIKAIKYGLGQVIAECGVDIKKLQGKDNSKTDEIDDIERPLLELKERIESQFRFNKINNLILRDILCAVYNMLMKMNEDDFDLLDKLQIGELDNLPSRYIIKKKRYYEVL